ncbi:hypothetical protein QN382_22175 [Pseudomonas sp. 10B1]|uniref:hypothetical protein n=1 Tax=unclassified Pseudomonas TaxID=196821 RepID=UPI002AB4A736|nr:MULTISPECIES: hypothetical protein [unclassified Pseudomonas]MDY7561080.1 hypothetical protein [Pseudomonas sp. AB6]MEA9979814.1 hypothetical protein [Pseudomonas sp. RTS4]MEA9997380.1 hypothetical protein [Pseudomonas sp. AA4]MEB0089373.1 hypothetical protein [Pseudomonas sp. RTI1]MEB0128541.1 hypothetical protein [Pseudomonas sp. CCC1.2]
MNNVVLSILNVAALAALVTFQFQGSEQEIDHNRSLALPSHGVHETAKLAVIHQRRGMQAILATQSKNDDTSFSMDRSERWVF